MRSITELNCAFCLKPIKVDTRTIKYERKRNPDYNFYCSKECSNQSQITSVINNCLVCNAEILVLQSVSKKGYGKFCSHHCSATYNNAQRKINGFSTKGQTKSVICSDCKIEIIISIHAPTETARCVDCKKIRREFTRKKSLIDNNCIICGKIFKTYSGRPNKCCSKECLQETAVLSGLKSASVQSDRRRSKNEIYFAELCGSKFSDVIENIPMFPNRDRPEQLWDADVIIPSLKLAIMWNGIWHYQKLGKNHNLEQVQSRDKIKLAAIENFGYTSYIIKDLGKHNKKFVEEEFEKFLRWIEENKKHD